MKQLIQEKIKKDKSCLMKLKIFNKSIMKIYINFYEKEGGVIVIIINNL